MATKKRDVRPPDIGVAFVRREDGVIEATPTARAMVNRHADLATALAAKLVEAARLLEDPTPSPKRARLARRVVAAWRAFEGVDETQAKLSRRMVLVEVLDAARGPRDAYAALGRLQDKLGDVDVPLALVVDAIRAWSLRGREKWGPIRALARALDCDADLEGAFRCEIGRLLKVHRLKQR